MVWRKWIKDKGFQHVADRLGITYETVRAWVNDGMNPKDSTKKRLVRMAKGEFGYADFFK